MQNSLAVLYKSENQHPSTHSQLHLGFPAEQINCFPRPIQSRAFRSFLARLMLC